MPQVHRSVPPRAAPLPRRRASRRVLRFPPAQRRQVGRRTTSPRPVSPRDKRSRSGSRRRRGDAAATRTALFFTFELRTVRRRWSERGRRSRARAKRSWSSSRKRCGNHARPPPAVPARRGSCPSTAATASAKSSPSNAERYGQGAWSMEPMPTCSAGNTCSPAEICSPGGSPPKSAPRSCLPVQPN